MSTRKTIGAILKTKKKRSRVTLAITGTCNMVLAREKFKLVVPEPENNQAFP